MSTSLSNPRRTGWLCALVIGTLIQLPTVVAAQGFCICGDIDGSGTVRLHDLYEYLNWLYDLDPGFCADSATGDIDGFATVTLRDVVWAHRFVLYEGAAPSCDSIAPPWIAVSSPDFFLVHDTLFPKGDSVHQIDITLIHQQRLSGFSMAFQIRVDGALAEFDTDEVWLGPPASDPRLLIWESFNLFSSYDLAIVGGTAIMLSLPPARRPMTNMINVYAAPSPVDRTITVELLDMYGDSIFFEPSVNRNSFIVDSMLNMWELTVGPSGCPYRLTGDGDGSGTLTSSDIILLVNYVFKGREAPLPCAPASDVTYDLSVNSTDIIYLVDYVFRGGGPPCDVCTVTDAATKWGCF